ncbi:MAG: lysylphosphatidylglycerol synthase transmembrane domain-containing protein [Paludibacter sp.]|nr:lysylphosphatidylglycerol synthase transmembrane domain-containing protein [Paludibacter sp.]
MDSTRLFSSITKHSGNLSSKSAVDFLGVLFFILSVAFLVYKLFTFHQYAELAAQWQQTPLSRAWWLAYVVFLLPLNWLLEAVKWRMLTSRVQKISLNTAVKAILSGISTGFFTPNRVGELVGRIAFLKPEHRNAGVTLSIVNSLTQNIVMALYGIPACILFFSYTSGLRHDMIQYVSITLIGILFIGIIYFTLPHWSRQLKSGSLSVRIKTFTDCLSAYNLKDLVQILAVSMLRYIVFCMQFYFMLRFFNIALTPWQALVSIPTTYLFVTFTPSLAFSEAAVRSSFAVLIIGAFSGQVINIALAGVCIWVINFIVPMLIGSVVMIKRSI